MYFFHLKEVQYLRHIRNKLAPLFSTIESEFIVMVAASKEVEWIRNLLLDIKLWLQSISIISLYCDNETTMS